MNERSDFYRPTWIDIDLGAIAHNLGLVRETLASETELLIPIKANAYGHGALEVAKLLEHKGVAFLGLATVDEAVFLREKGIRIPILILNAVLEKEIEAVLEHDLIQTISDEESAKQLEKAASRRKRIVPVHVKVDTGMGRLGLWHEEAFFLMEALQHYPHLFVEGIYTHFANADETDPKRTKEQLGHFQELISTLKKKSLLPQWRHIANSAGLLYHPESHLNLARPGLAVYGIHPCPPREGKEGASQLQPALTLTSRIVYLKRTPKGRKISYGGTYTTSKETLIATLPIGYADGYNRLLSNKGKVLVRGQFAPIVGRVCMDQTMIDVGEVPKVSVGDEVVLIGRQGNHEIRVDELATHCNTISYEILTSLSSRIPRCYRKSPEPIKPLVIDKTTPSSV